jgi:hypothetical protein
VGILAAHEFYSVVGKATSCRCSAEHNPVPLRFVWHHILPEACGGGSTSDNLVNVCDNCHFGIHALMSDMKNNNGTLVKFKRFAGTMRHHLAIAGYQRAVAAGTVDKIPNEGSV